MTAQHMLQDMLYAIRDEHACTTEEAYDMLITWIGVNTHVEMQLPTDGIKFAAYEKLQALFDVNELIKDKWDWFGELLMQEGILAPLEGPAFFQQEAEAQLSTIHLDSHMPQPFLVQGVQTGRYMIALHNVAGDKAIYFGMESDLRLYRTAVLNAHIYGIPFQILHADSTQIDSSLDSQNWRQSNLWNPVKASKLKQKM